MLTRLLNLLKAKMNKGMAQLETPEVLAEQAQDQLETSIKKTKEAVVASVTNEKMLEQQIKKCQEELVTWEKRAAVAVQQNNDEVARQCLQRKQELKQNADTLTGQLAEQKTSTANLKKRYEELGEEFKDFQRKKSSLSARGNASDAMSKANELLTGGVAGASKVDQMEQKIAQKEFKAEALREMSQEPTKNAIEDLDKNAQVDDELAALKAQMQQPKLIEEKE